MKAIQGVVRDHMNTKLPGIPMNPSDEELGDELWEVVEEIFVSANLDREAYNKVRLT